MAEADDRPRRVDVGFAGGQMLSLRMKPDAHEALRRALEGGGTRWHEVETADSTVAVDLQQVVYVRLDTEEHKVGF